jgi:hypothetical protein
MEVGTREYEKARMLDFAARLEQIHRELREFQKEHKGALMANHEIGVTMASIFYSAARLTKWAGL